MRLIRNQKGFSALEIAIFVIVMGLIGSGGYYVVQRQNDSAAPEQAQTQDEADSETTADGAEDYNDKVQTIYEDGTVVMTTHSEFAETTDQRAILAALGEHCETGTVGTVNQAVFTSPEEDELFVRKGNYVRLSASCETPTKTINELSGEGYTMYLRKLDQGWKVDFATTDYPDCDKAESLDYPAKVIPLCSGEGETEVHNRS